MLDLIHNHGSMTVRHISDSGPAEPRKPGSMAGEIRIAPDSDRLPEDMEEVFGMRERSP
jgi:hypothetical protein